MTCNRCKNHLGNWVNAKGEFRANGCYCKNVTLYPFGEWIEMYGDLWLRMPSTEEQIENLKQELKAKEQNGKEI